MKKYFALLILIMLPFAVMAFTVPEKPSSYVNDYTGTLSAEQVTALESKVASFEKNTTKEIAVVLVNSLGGDTVENVAQNIFTEWGIGKADKNNGVLLLVSVGDRTARIHTGYGVEGDLPDIATHYIQQDFMIPAFREGDYYTGVNLAVDKMTEALGGSNIVPNGYTENQSAGGLNYEMIFFLAFVVFEVLISMLAKSKSWWGGGVVGGVAGGGVIWYFGLAFLAGVFAFIVPVILGLVIDYFVSKSYGKARTLGTYPWWMGRGGGGMGGGGFGGFGGGSSGGGGSSSSW